VNFVYNVILLKEKLRKENIALVREC